MPICSPFRAPGSFPKGAGYPRAAALTTRLPVTGGAVLRLSDNTALAWPRGRVCHDNRPVNAEEELSTVVTEGSVPGRLRSPTAIATEVLLLRPHGVEESAATSGTNGLWPMFVMVVTEPAEPVTHSVSPLVRLLDGAERTSEVSAVAVEPVWSVLDPSSALLTLTVRAAFPVAADMTILLPAAPVLDLLEVVARGATIGVTTRDRADRLRGRVDVGTALRDVVLLHCLPSPASADLASALRTAREG